MIFKVGDLVKGNNDYYSSTNYDMAIGKVIKVNYEEEGIRSHDGDIRVEIIKHKCKTEQGSSYWVYSKYFLPIFNCDFCDLYNVCDKINCYKEDKDEV